MNKMDHKNPISCLWTDLIFFFFTWKFDDILLYLKWLTKLQKFVIIICCKINFDVIWYSVIFSATLYLSLFVWSSDFLSFALINDLILVYNYEECIMHFCTKTRKTLTVLIPIYSLDFELWR